MYTSNIFRFLNKAVLTLAVSAVFLLSFSSDARSNDTDEPENNIVETAVAANQFNTLVAAVKAAGLVETLVGEGPFTVFAPTDEAFAALPEGTVESLLKPENKEKLTAILTYHVVAGKVMAADVAGIESADTVQGGALSIAVKYGNVMINDAKVISADVEATNGVIHVIDKVLMPTK